MELTLREILTTINTMVPNSLSYELKIQWINHIQNQLFRDYPVPEAFHSFVTLPDEHEQIYTLPGDCTEDSIKQVVVGGEPTTTFRKDRIRIWGKRRLYDCAGFLNHLSHTDQTRKRLCPLQGAPSQLTVNDLDKVPVFPTDFSELLILGCASRVAKTTPETMNLVNVFG